MLKRFLSLIFVSILLASISLLFETKGDTAAQTYARRVFPIFDHTGPCSENQIGYDMLAHEFYICKNTGWTIVGSGGGGGGGGISNFNGLTGATQAFAVGTTGTDFNISSVGTIHTFNIPNASASSRGLLSAADWALFNSKQAALGFTPENVANKNLPNGYAGLSGGKIPVSVVQELLSINDLLEYSDSSGTGTTAIRATIISPANGQLLGWNGSNWVNVNPVMTSVFGRTGAVVAQTGDYSAAQVTNAFDKTTSNILTLISTPGAPAVGFLTLWADNTDKILKARDSNGNISTTVRAISCASTDKLRAIGADGVGICAADQTSAGGTGITSLNTLTAATQTFSRTNDTNVTLTITSTTADHNFTLGWTGTLAAGRLNSNVVQAVTNDTNVTGTISAQTLTLGWTGTLADSRVADVLSLTQIPNQTTNGFIKTSSGNGTLTIDTSTYVDTSSTQSITGQKTFDAAKLVVGAVATDPSVVVGAFYRDLDDNKLYWGVQDTTPFWGEVFVAGKSVLNLASSNVTGILPRANGGTGGTLIPYDISTQIDGKPAINLQVLRYVAARTINLDSSGHKCSAVTAATAQTDFVVAVNGTSKGTLRFAASGTTCTIVSGATATIAAGDVVTITAPASQDATLSDVAFTLSAGLQ